MDAPRTPTDGAPESQPEDRHDSDRKAAGTVFAVMVGALLLAALMNADVMLTRAESGPLGLTRDLSLAFWEPVEQISSSVGLTAPRRGLDALQDLDRTGPAPPVLDERIGERGASESVAGPTTTAVAPEASSPVALGHAPAPETTPTEPEPSTPLGPLDPPVAGPLSPTKPGLPGLPPLETIRRDAEPSFALRRPTGDDPLRLLIVGDSTLDAVGSSMLRELAATAVTSAVLDYRVSTGLSRPDYFDWPSHLAQLTPQLEPEIVVIMLGANDAQAFAIDNQAVEFGTEQWFAAYRARVAAVLDQLTVENRWVVWIGQPVMRTEVFDARMRQINQLVVEEVARYPTATFVDSRSITVDESGGYTGYLPDGSGTPQQIRQGDGIHLTAAGGDRLAPLVIEAVNEIAPLY